MTTAMTEPLLRSLPVQGRTPPDKEAEKKEEDSFPVFRSSWVVCAIFAVFSYRRSTSLGIDLPGLQTGLLLAASGPMAIPNIRCRFSPYPGTCSRSAQRGTW